LNFSIALFLPFSYNLYLLCSDDEEPPTYATTVPPPSPVAIDEPVEPDVAPRATGSGVKKVPQTRHLKCTKKAKEAEVSLEAHASIVSSDDVSNSSFLSFLSYTFTLTHFFFSGFSEEIYCPGHRVCGVPKGCKSFRRYNFDVQSPLVFCTLSFVIYMIPYRLLMQLL
jgi:hypothetical protein